MLVTLRPTRRERDREARAAAIEQYRLGAAFLRTTAESIEAGCSDRPCPDAARYRRMAARADAAAWLEQHDPIAPGGDE